jgi:hypothetical protein
MQTSIREKPYYKPLLWAAAALCFAILIWLGMDSVTNPDLFSGDDFVEYWAAGRLNITGGNPYDPAQLHPLELQTGLIEGDPVLWWSPPWVLSIMLPFSYPNYALSRTLWMVLSIIIIFICLTQLWNLYGGKNQYRWMAWILGFTFIPILDGLKKGQTSALLLLGLVGFLYFIQHRKYLLAGVFISLLTVKPHILYLFFLAVILWTIDQRKWRVIVGIFLSLLLMTAITWIANPKVLNQFIFALIHTPPADLATPTIGGLLRFIFGVEKFWLQFLAPLLGVIWLLIYWIRKRKTWNWLEEAPILILVSTLTAAYGWSWDQTVSIVAIIQIAVLLIPFAIRPTSVLISISYLTINLLLLTMRVNQFWTFWLAPTLLIFYLAARKLLPMPQPSNAIVEPD